MGADPLTLASAGATILSVVGQIQAGNAADTAAKYEAAQLKQRALAQEATAQRAAIETTKKADYIQSRAIALAAAGGGDTTDVGTQNVLSDIKNEGEYRALTDLYEGRDAAASSRAQAEASLFEGKYAKQSSRYKAGGTILGSAKSFSSMFDSPATPALDVRGNPMGTPWKNPDANKLGRYR